MNNLNVKTLALLTASTKAETKSRKAESAAIDAVQSDGFTSLHFMSPNKKESLCTEEQWLSLKGAVIKSFTQSEQKLLSYENTKGLSDKQKELRRAKQQDIGKQIGKWKQALTRRETADREPVTTTFEERTYNSIDTLIRKLSKVEQFRGDIVTLEKMLKKSLELIEINSKPNH